ncbi:D-amino acid oxidase-like protein [Bisporella sp. PMI_857]|nr:D-amino acid oxidase-like protein [Bisporella sp. PMI_857]
MAKTSHIVVIGAGVSGLTTALILAENPRNRITIVAKHMPGDYDIEYCSPWAGADYAPFGTAGSIEARWEHETWGPLAHLAHSVPEAGIHFEKARSWIRKTSTGDDGRGDLGKQDPWFKDTVPDFRVLRPEELPHGIEAGIEFTSVCINTALYLPYLVGQCRKHGIILKRQILGHISEATASHKFGQNADIVINCTGLMASRLGGVEDKTMQPARGQTVLVRNDSKLLGGANGTEDGRTDENVYFMNRASGGGTIIGGSYQLGNWESQPDPNLAMRIMQRAVDLHPQLAGGKGVSGLSIVRHAVGLRPWREAGVRLEKERIGKQWVVHNYGHAGYGYQTSYACARDVAKLVDEIVGEAET